MGHEGGLLRHLIADKYTPESLVKIKEVLTARRSHELHPIANGLFAASPSQAPDSATGYQNVWVRDNVMLADSLRRRGELAAAIACIEGLTRFFEKQFVRFREIIGDPVRVLKENTNRRPHIRFTAETLEELPGK